jgi:FkbM family methyltransferase
MRLKTLLANNNLLRSVFLPILRLLDFELCLKHDVTKRKFYLLSFLHKGYWYYGSKREENELKRFNELISRGDTVLEIGAHIGYVTQIFEELVGKTGKVLVAEPTEFSRQFLSKNIRSDTKILPVAVSNTIGQMDFYTEQFGGFTNSLVGEFTARKNKSLSESYHVQSTRITKTKVDVSTIDGICEQNCISPHLIKVDVEGAELNVLEGAAETLKNVHALMVEVNENHEEVYKLLFDSGFNAFLPNGDEVIDNFPGGNIFFVKHNMTNLSMND